MFVQLLLLKAPVNSNLIEYSSFDFNFLQYFYTTLHGQISQSQMWLGSC